MALLVVLVGVGAFLAYQNTLPTTVATNIKDGQKDVPADGSFLFKFSRSIAIDALKSAMTVTPVTDGGVSAVSGQTDYAWTPTRPLLELTTYSVTLKTITDTSHHVVHGGKWTFTTIIVPFWSERVMTSVMIARVCSVSARTVEMIWPVLVRWKYPIGSRCR